MMRVLRTWGLMIAFVTGGLLSGLHALSFIIPYCVAAMLTITFLGLDTRQMHPQQRHAAILAANVLLGLVPWAILKALGYDNMAEAAFFAGMAGEAASAPVIIHMLGGNAEFACTGLLLNSFTSALSLCVFIPLLIGTPSGELPLSALFVDVTQQVFGVLIFPCLLAFLLRRVYPKSRGWSRKLKDVSFAIWMVCMVVVAATAVHRVQAADSAWQEIAAIAAAMGAICLCGFTLGRCIGGRRLGLECGQCLGQKNATVGIYLAMHYSAPLVFLGPAIYLFFHHLYTTWQMVQHGRRLSRSKAAE